MIYYTCGLSNFYFISPDISQGFCRLWIQGKQVICGRDARVPRINFGIRVYWLRKALRRGGQLTNTYHTVIFIYYVPRRYGVKQIIWMEKSLQRPRIWRGRRFRP